MRPLAPRKKDVLTKGDWDRVRQNVRESEQHPDARQLDQIELSSGNAPPAPPRPNAQHD